MKKVIFSILTVFILFIFQTSVFHHLAFNGIVPNFLLIVVCAYGNMRGESEGIIAGFFCGLLIDIFYASFIGLNSLIFLFIGFFNGMLNRFYIDEDMKLSILCVGISDIVFSFITYSLRFLLNGKFNIDYYFFYIILPEFVYTIGVSFILLPILRLIEYRVIPFTVQKDEDVI